MLTQKYLSFQYGKELPPQATVILPTYNEVTNIIPLVNEILERTSQFKIEVQIVIVDDDSNDGTIKFLYKTFGTDKRVKLVERKNQRSLATAIWRGISEADYPVIVIMDADFNHTPRDVMRLLSALNGYDIVIGSRYIRGGGMNTSLVRYYLSWVFNLLVRFILNIPISDSLSGFLVISKKVCLEISSTIFKGYGDYAIRFIFYAYRLGYRIKEVPIIYEERLGGKSKTRFLFHFIQYLTTVLELRYRVNIK